MVRNSILGGACVIAVFWLCSVEARAQDAKPGAAALKLLKEGNERFAANQPAKRDIGEARRKELAKGQRPGAIVLACADSRVAPELIFDQGLGEMLVLRVAGNVTDPDILGSIEYGVAELKAPLIVVVGHESCGAVKAALTREPVTGNLRKLLDRIHLGDVVTEGKAALSKSIRNNVVYQVEELTRKSALLKEFIDRERVSVAAGVYSLETGRVEWLELPRKSVKP
jgi:carbonic anhydrase